MSENQKGFAAFLAKKDIVFSAKRYGIDALGAMAQGLFASLLIGTILKTLGQQLVPSRRRSQALPWQFPSAMR